MNGKFLLNKKKLGIKCQCSVVLRQYGLLWSAYKNVIIQTDFDKKEHFWMVLWQIKKYNAA